MKGETIMVIKNSPPHYDHDEVVFEIDGVIKGFGFIPREGDKTVALIRCPRCGRENYALNVASGKCTWCPFNTSSIKHTERDITHTEVAQELKKVIEEIDENEK